MTEANSEQRFGNYILRHILGKQGSSRVYLGEHILFHTPVAIKLIDQQTENIPRFIEQATVLTRLKHPHIVPILDFGVHDGSAYLVMQYMSNGDLRQRHPRGTRLTMPTIVAYVRQLASALDHVHEQHKIVHRDVKPHNMLPGPQGEIMLSDFGIAVPSHSLHGTLTFLDDFEGTAPYAAPEQLRGAPRCASDQYALGIVVYEWLSGTWPFTGDFAAITHQHFFAPPPSLRAQGVDIPDALEAVVMRVLEKEPEQRFPSVGAFADALEHASNSLQGSQEEILVMQPAEPFKRQFITPRLFNL
ncbi:MAG TPA: serine/threonine-protein kinase [Ktedonobacteraceae bacterium]|nr:serine/threonine-protein kinase [Ktedonobacteraceae bacterium]